MAETLEKNLDEMEEVTTLIPWKVRKERRMQVLLLQVQ